MATLVNLGVTCYLNVVVQYLKHTTPFVEQLHTLCATFEKKHDVVSDEQIMLMELDKVLQEMNSANDGMIINPESFFKALCSMKSDVDFHVMNDPHEVFKLILKVIINETITEECFIKEIFHGYVSQTLICTGCNMKTSDKAETFGEIIVNFPSSDESGPFMLSELISAAEQICYVGSHCDYCQVKTCKAQHSTYTLFPKHLLMTINRFVLDENFHWVKSQHRLLVDESLYFKLDGVKSRYVLHSIIAHRGRSAVSGHYVVYIKSKEWFVYDDIRRDTCTTDEIHKVLQGLHKYAPYVLGYMKDDPDDQLHAAGSPYKLQEVSGADDVVAGASKRDEPDDQQVNLHAAGPPYKRYKLNASDPTVPTCVLSLRGLPKDLTEAQVWQLASQFGNVANIILTQNKLKALVQMADLASAVKMYDYYRKSPLLVFSCQVSVTYSKHSALTVKVGENNVLLDQSRRVLHVIVDNMKHPVCLELLVEYFSKHGQIAKIVVFNHNDTFHSLIQFTSGADAYKGKLMLNGQNLYLDCCRLFIEYSKLNDLVVKYNSEISRDYTNAGLGWVETRTFETVTSHEGKDDAPGNVLPGDATANEAAQRKSLLPMPRISTEEFVLQPLVTGMPSKYLAPRSSEVVITNPFYAGPQPTPPPPSHQGGTFLPKKVPWCDRRPVVLVSNLDEGRVTTDLLFTLFGVYGDVIRVKICVNTKSKALIQYKDYKYARDAVMNLDGTKLWGRQLKLTISKYRIVQMPKDGAHSQNANLTQDYTSSRWHRFHSGDRESAPVVPPSKTLFLANIPPKVTETTLKRMFNACGTVVDFKFFDPSNLFRLQQAVKISQLPANSKRQKEIILNSTPERRMALIQMSTVEEGIDGLMMLHNKQFPGTNRYLCVSFTASVIEHRDTDGH